MNLVLTIGGTGMKIDTDIHVSLKTNCKHFGDLLGFSSSANISFKKSIFKK